MRNSQQSVLSHFSNRCVYCDEVFGSSVYDAARNFRPVVLEWDHFVPRSLGGKGHQQRNLLPSCSICNRIKTSFVFESFIEARQYIQAERTKKGFSSHPRSIEILVNEALGLCKNVETNTRSISVSRVARRLHRGEVTVMRIWRDDMHRCDVPLPKWSSWEEPELVELMRRVNSIPYHQPVQAQMQCSVIEDGAQCTGIVRKCREELGYCEKHHQRWKAHGDPLIGKRKAGRASRGMSRSV